MNKQGPDDAKGNINAAGALACVAMSEERRTVVVAAGGAAACVGVLAQRPDDAKGVKPLAGSEARTIFLGFDQLRD